MLLDSQAWGLLFNNKKNMMNQQTLDSAREIIGQFLSNVAKEKKLTIYQLEKATGLPSQSIHKVLRGEKNYNVDTLLQVIKVLDLYVFFTEKEGNHLNFEHMNKKMNENDPKL